MQQSYDIEIVVVNDGCKYDKYYKKIIKNTFHIKILDILNLKNKGVSEALNMEY